MNEAGIACVLQEVRAAATFEETHRLDSLRHANPPKHESWTVMLDAIALEKS